MKIRNVFAKKDSYTKKNYVMLVTILAKAALGLLKINVYHVTKILIENQKTMNVYQKRDIMKIINRQQANVTLFVKLVMDQNKIIA